MKKKYTPIEKHKRTKSVLKPPMRMLNMQLVDWRKDLLPEHLWIDLLAEEYKEHRWYDIYNDFINKLEDELPDKSICLFGFITDFGIVPKEAQESFIHKHKDFIHFAFFRPIGKSLVLYPESPANWLLLEDWKNAEPVDFEVELNKLHRSVLRLMPGKDLYTGHIRAVPLNRLFKHNKIFYKKGMKVADLLHKYPGQCTEDEKYYVQSHARIQMNMQYSLEERFNAKQWSKYFWRHNYDLVPCSPSRKPFDESYKVEENEMEVLYKNIEINCSSIINYLDRLGMQYRYDFYDTTKDEILLGLFSRIARLYLLFVSNPRLWSRDISGIFLRCIAESAIIFSYLVKKGTIEEFQSFKKYGEGKEKLLMLHLEDTYQGQKSYEGDTPDEIAEELGGGMNPELIDIDLSDWTKKSTREMAIEAGLKDIYSLVFDPASTDIHGTWTSIRKSNLVYCEVALHGMHKMPGFVEPPLLVDAARVAHTIFVRSLEIGINVLSFPRIDNDLIPFEYKKKKDISN